MTLLRAALRWFVTPQDDWISRFCSTVAMVFLIAGGTFVVMVAVLMMGGR